MFYTKNDPPPSPLWNISENSSDLVAPPLPNNAIANFESKSADQVTAGDLVMVLADLGAPMGSKIRLEKILAIGSKDFTLLGRPVLPR